MPKNETAPDSSIVGPSNEDRIYSALRKFQGVRNHTLRTVLAYASYALLLLSATTLIFTKSSFLMYISMIIAVALNILFFQILMKSIPEALAALWDQGIIGDNSPGSLKESGLFNGNDVQGNNLIRPPELAGRYERFINEMEVELNSPIRQFSMALAFSLVLFARSFYEFWTWLPDEFWTGLIYRAGGLDALIEGIKLHLYVYFAVYSVEEPLRFWLGVSIEPFLGFLLGLIAWRMLVTGRYIGELKRRFDINPKMGHPDRCGGLEPMGNLALLNALIISIWGLFLGGWIILASRTEYGSFYEPLYSVLLIIPILMAILSFILPLWGTHVVMISKKAALKQQLNQLSIKIDLLSRKRLEATCGLRECETDTSEDLENLKALHKEYSSFPTWPFNYRILLALITSQAVPFLGLTGLGAPILNIISSLMNFLGSIGKV
jgi:hypothetical protein